MNGKDNSSLEYDIPLVAVDTRDPADIPNNAVDASCFQMVQPPTIAKLLCAQMHNAYYRMQHTQVGLVYSYFNVNIDGLLVQRSRVDGAFQIARPSLLRQHILQFSHHKPIAGHFGQHRTYDKIVRKYHWAYMAAEVEHTVSVCESCEGNNPTYCHKREVQLSSGAGPFDFSQWISSDPSWRQHNKRNLSYSI